MLRKFIIVFAFIFGFLFTCQSQNYTLEKLKAVHIYIFASYINWPNQDTLEFFKISIVGNDTKVFEELKEITNSKYIHNKPIKIFAVQNASEIKNAQIIYISKSNNNELPQLLNQYKAKNTLLITESASFEKTMINFVYKDNNLKFELNENNISQTNLVVATKLLAMVKTKDELQKLYIKSEEFLESQNEIIKNQKIEINNQENEILIQLKEIEQQKTLLFIQKENIANQKTHIDSQNHILINLNSEIISQQNYLQIKIDQLIKQELVLNDQKKYIENKKRELMRLESTVIQKKQESELFQKKIEKQDLILSEKISKIRTQRLLLYTIALSFIITTLLLFFLFRSFKNKKKINTQLKEKNKAIAQQKKEIEFQQQKLLITNKELEKLSIVASKTDNAVIIMNSKGDYEWVNDAFVRLYGYTIKELIKNKGENILNANSPINIKDLINLWFKNKETVVLESENQTKEGAKIWVQTTITPILDKKGEITKLVAIDSNITQIKNAEQVIIQEKEKSDKLLLNILPHQIAEELKNKGVVKPKVFEDVSVLFCDIVDFTSKASLMDSELLIAELNEIFTAFDDIMDNNKCERIKTIGDAYMAVCGINIKNINHATILTKASLEMIRYIEKRNQKAIHKWEVRCGINSGKIVGGIVGVKKYIYDIFGDTINVAARMEHHSQPMNLNVSEVTYFKIKENFRCIERIPIEVKGKGIMKMYFVNSQF